MAVWSIHWVPRLIRLRRWVTRVVVIAMAAVVALVANVAVATIAAVPAQADGSTGPAGLLVPAAGRLIDTRQSTPLASGVARLVQVTGQAGIPATGVAAVAVTITAVTPAYGGYLWAAADGQRPRKPRC